VKVSDVKKVRSQLLALGQVFQLISTMTQPLEPTSQPFEFHYAT
jgi:hypothetical protein